MHEAECHVRSDEELGKTQPLHAGERRVGGAGALRGLAQQLVVRRPGPQPPSSKAEAAQAAGGTFERFQGRDGDFAFGRG